MAPKNLKITIKNCDAHADKNNMIVWVFYLADKCPYCDLLKRHKDLQKRNRND